MNRMITLIITELTSDKLRYEENIENLINGKEDVSERIRKIKENLRNIVLVEQMVDKWKQYTMQQDQPTDNK